jgi:CotH kinase protein
MNKNIKLYLVISAVLSPLAPTSGRAQGHQQSLMARFDKDGDKKLNAGERKAALTALDRGFRNPLNGVFARLTADRISPASVRNVPPTVPLYDLGTLRTLFFEFEDANWERELMAFKETDIEIPATLIVDGKTYKEVGVQFRGNSSFSMVPEGKKHSFNVSMDAFVKGQNLLGYTSLNLLNGHSDPSFLHSVLFLQASRDFIPAARANWVRVVINGEYWGVYPNVEQVNKTFLKEWFKTDVGSRFKAPGSPWAQAGLEYWGNDPASYKGTYEIKSKDDPKAWEALIRLTRVLNTTTTDKLETALAPILDIDGALRFLALDATLSNNDGYWVRASDYNMYLDSGGKFHIIPNDINETYGGHAPGFAMSGGPTGPDPLVGLNDAKKPLRSKLLAVPALRAKYLSYTREIATKWLNWKTLEPLATRYQALIAPHVKADVRKLDSFAAFEAGPAELKAYAERRSQLILNYPQK